jgi:hypothetical protein
MADIVVQPLKVSHRRMGRVRALLLCFTLAGPVAGVWAQPQGPTIEAARVARERERIQAERDRLEALFAAEQARCSERFAVTACVDDVRQRRRAALAAPTAQALALDDAERRERAAARRQAVQDKQRRAAETPAPTLPLAATGVSAAAPAVPPVTASSAAAQAVAAPRAPDAAASAAARQRAAASRQRQQDIKAGQARIEAREAARKQGGKAAAPLSVPAPARAASALKPGLASK